MKKLNQILIACMVAGVATACVTDDPRGGLKQPFIDEFGNAAGLGEVCKWVIPDDCASDADCGVGGTCSFDADYDGNVCNRTCDSGFTCYDERGSLEVNPDFCLTDRFAAACTTAPTCGDGFCAARGDATVATFCNCDSGNVWNGGTCIEDVFPEWPGSLTETTCPAAEIAPGVPDPTTADCPADSFCDGRGRCLEQFVELDGSISSNTFSGSVTLGEVLTLAECRREYYSDGDDDDDLVTGNGYQLVITGNLADTLITGATEIVIDISENDAVGGGSFIVWPQTGAPDPAGDAGFVDFSVTGGTLGGTDEDGIGGYFSTISVTGEDLLPVNGVADDSTGRPADDPDDGDGALDDGTGVIGGQFFIGLGGTDYVSGAFTVDCGDNIDLGTEP